MYSIYVTIEEFQQNGGILEKGRTIYSEKSCNTHRYFNVSGTFLKHEEHQLIMHGGNASFPITPSVFYVKIDVTPIWR